jgi:hypothetical protein
VDAGAHPRGDGGRQAEHGDAHAADSSPNFYTTAIVEADGKVRFASDIYDLDARLAEVLRAR